MRPVSDRRSHPSLEGALAAVDDWGANLAVAAASGPGGVLATHGDATRVLPVASLTKLVTAWAALIAVEERAVTLDDPVGPPGSTLAHLLSHAGGYAFDSEQVLAAPGTRRIYSNPGYEAVAAHIAARTGIPFDTYLTEAVLHPLGMTSSRLRGSAAKDLHSNAGDLLLLLEELRMPTLLDRSTARRACTVQFPGLPGVLPGWGHQDACDWGFGPEIRGAKSPHWSGSTGPPDTFGHFGGSGTLVWLDPQTGLGCVALCDRPFGDWSIALWPTFSDGVRTAGRGLAL